MGETEPDAVDVWGTCLTLGCESYGIPVHVEKLWGLWVCGPCGQTKTDITTIPPTQIKELPAWILEKLQTQN